MHFAHRLVYCYHEFKLGYLKNQKLFSIRVNELFEPTVLRKKGDGFLLFFKSRHVNATKSYLHFDHFAGEAILCSNFFCFSLFLDVLFLS